MSVYYVANISIPSSVVSDMMALKYCTCDQTMPRCGRGVDYETWQLSPKQRRGFEIATHIISYYIANCWI